MISQPADFLFLIGALAALLIVMLPFFSGHRQTRRATMVAIGGVFLAVTAVHAVRLLGGR